MYIYWKKRSGVSGESLYAYLYQNKRVEGKAHPVTTNLGYLGSIRTDASKAQRALFWENVITVLEAHNLSVEQRQKIEAAIGERVPRAKNLMGDAKAPVEWYTPQEYIEMARAVLGEIDLDPATNSLAQKWIKASSYFTKDDDGLAQQWYGRVWCNPPYGRRVNQWLEKAIDSYETGEIEAVILLLNRTGAAWYSKLKKRVSAVCEVQRRIAFIDEKGQQQKSPRYYNDFLYLGRDVKTFKRVFGKLEATD